MAKLPIPRKISQLWHVWQLRGCIILSLFLQAFLVLFAPMRQRSNSTLLLFFVWSAYVLADWVAAVGVGPVVQSQTDLCEPNGRNNDLFAFWASFLLLHLGGPDSITSFSLEDNELWLRHLLGLVLQVLGAAYSIFLTLPNNELWLPTALVFVVGTIKYGERTFALYLASWDRFGDTSLPEPEPGPDYEDAVLRAAAHEELVPVPAATSNSGDIIDHSPLPNSGVERRPECEVPKRVTDNSNDGIIKLLPVAYELYESFVKSFFVGLVPAPESQASSQNTFKSLKDDPLTAFRIVECELSLLYENLHTKVAVACGRIGYLLRFIGFCFLVISSMLFLFSVEKHGFDEFDTGVTYALLFGAIVLDFASFVQLISSDWNCALVAQSEEKYNWFWRFFGSITNTKRRWSGSVAQYDIISYCLDEPPTWVYKLADFFLGREIVDKIRISFFWSTEKVSDDVKEFFYSGLIRKIKALKDRGILNPSSDEDKSEFYSDEIFRSREDSANVVKDIFDNPRSSDVQEVGQLTNQYSELVKTILLLHLATIICCHEAKSSSNINERTRDHQGTLANETNEDDQLRSSAIKKDMKIMKLSTSYWFYIMVREQRMVFLDYRREEVFHRTCDEIKRFCKENKITRHAEACQKMKEKFLSGRSSDERQAFQDSVGSDGGTPLIRQACMTANSLLSEELVLESAKGLPFQFLLSASLGCRPTVPFAQQLSKGGEFLTFLSLLATHMGYETEQLFEH